MSHKRCAGKDYGFYYGLDSGPVVEIWCADLDNRDPVPWGDEPEQTANVIPIPRRNEESA